MKRFFHALVDYVFSKTLLNDITLVGLFCSAYDIVKYLVFRVPYKGTKCDVVFAGIEAICVICVYFRGMLSGPWFNSIK